MSYEDCAREAKAAERRRLRRESAERRAAGTGRRDTYKAGEVNRLVADWVATILHPDDEMRFSMRRIRGRARDLRRNNPYTRHFLNMLAVNVVGPTGFQHQARVRNNDGQLNRFTNNQIEEGWAEWCDDVTIGQPLSLNAFQRQSIKGVGCDGERFVRIWRGHEANRFGLALEAVNADMLDETYNVPKSDDANEIRMGVEVNGFGRPVAYHFWNKPEKILGTDFSPRERKRVPADEVIHLYDQDEANQTRGITWLLAVAVNLKMLDGYTEAELVAARTAAAKQGWFVKKGDTPQAGEGLTPDENNRVALEANPGLMDFAPDGYEFQSWTPEHPTGAFADFVKSKVREIATGVSVSYNALASDLENVNYSSLRSGLLLERDMWRMLQQWWIGMFLRRVYREWLNSALLTGALSLGPRTASKFVACKWTPRGWPWVDPEKDVNAAIAGIQSGLDSRTDTLAEQGRDFESILERLAEEEEMAAEYGVKISGPPVAAAPANKSGGDQKQNDAAVDPGLEEKVRARRRSLLRAHGRGRDQLELVESTNGKH